jgi:hypothetical protein
VAAVLGSCLRSLGYDLILAGRQAGYADTGTVPLFLAEFLGIPVITGIEELSPCAGGIEVKRMGGAGRERLRVRLPLLAVLGNSSVSALRAATLGDRMAASKREAERPDPPLFTDAPGDGDGEEGAGEGLRFSREARYKTCRFLPSGAALGESVAGLRADYLGKWEG